MLTTDPLHVEAGRPPPPSPPIVWWPMSDRTVTHMSFWPAAAFALSLTPTGPAERGILERLAEIGVIPGERFDEAALGPDVVTEIEEGMDDALTDLMRAAEQSPDDTPTHRTRPDTDRDYFARALGALRSVALVGPAV